MLARETAFKLIAPRALAKSSAEAMEVVRLRFEREAKATAGLRSPHTVTISDYGPLPAGRAHRDIKRATSWWGTVDSTTTLPKCWTLAW